MKIVQALGWYLPESLGGTEVYVGNLSRHLRECGHEVWIAAPDAGRIDERTYVEDGTPVYRYPIPPVPTREECQQLTPVRGAEHFRRWLSRIRPEVVHVHTLGTGLGLAELAAARHCGARVIVTSHSASLGYLCQRGTMLRWGERLCDGICRPAKCASCELHHKGMAKPLARLVGTIPPVLGRASRRGPGRLGTALAMTDLITRNQAHQRRLLELVDRFVVLTGWGLEAVLANGAPREKLALNRLGIGHRDVQRKPGPESRPTTRPVQVGYLGRFEAIKGVRELVRAVVSLPPDVPLRLELRGPLNGANDRSMLADLRGIARDDPRIRFRGPAQGTDVLAALAGYDLLACPSLALEGGPTVALEAHAVGTPVVGSRMGGLAEIVTDGVNGRLVPPADWRSLATVLRHVAADPSGTVDRWRASLPRPRTMDDVAADYLALYAA